MHTDRKIGFALGILLVGIVAALFFRNEPLMPTERVSVRREQELNERLRERDVAVYLVDSATKSGDPDDPDAPAAEGEQPWTLRDILKNMGRKNKGQPSPVGTASPANDGRLDGRPPQSLDGFRSIRESDDPSEDSVSPAGPGPGGGALNPLVERKLPPFPAGSPLPETTNTSSVPDSDVPDDPEVAERSGGDGPHAFIPPVDFEEYVVRYGDTLSGISQRMLGSQARYKEIFEANRDRMSSPDQLQVGKPIRIPRVAGEPKGPSL